MNRDIASPASGSRIPNFFKLSIRARIAALRERTALTEADILALENGTHVLKRHVAYRDAHEDRHGGRIAGIQSHGPHESPPPRQSRCGGTGRRHGRGTGAELRGASLACYGWHPAEPHGLARARRGVRCGSAGGALRPGRRRAGRERRHQGVEGTGDRAAHDGQDSEASVGETASRSSACGKVILLGEHAVVYGRWALAAPIPLAVEARVVDSDAGVRLRIQRWGVEQRVPPLHERPTGTAGMLALLLQRLELDNRSMAIEVFPDVPRAVGLGSSAALAVSVIRALDGHFHLGLDGNDINNLARCRGYQGRRLRDPDWWRAHLRPLRRARPDRHRPHRTLLRVPVPMVQHG